MIIARFGRHLVMCVTLILCSCVSDKRPASSSAKASQAGQDGRPPSVRLVSGPLSVLQYLPDTRSGHYRGSRFDWSSMIGEARLGQTVFWNEWNPSTSATGDHDNAVGPAMEFGMNGPLGYDEAAVGEGFLKIGVGVLRRASDKPYFFRNAYEVLDYGLWTVQQDGRRVSLVHRVSHRGFAYRYTKVVSVAEGSRLMVTCRLENTGTRPITTDVYAHHFFRPGDQGWTPDISIRFDRPIQLDTKARPANAIAVDGASLNIVGPLPGRASAYAQVNYGPGSVPTGFTLYKPGLEMQMLFGFGPSRMVLFGLQEVVCVEPFMDIHLEPGQHRQWTYTYVFRAQSGS